MNMILDINACSNPGLGFILRIFKLLFTVIEVAAPIVLIVSLGIILTKLVADPSNDKLKKRLTNAILSCVIVFLLPLLVNLTMSLFGQKYSFSQCWNNAYSSTGSSRYIEKDSEGKTPTKVYVEPDEYEKGSSGINPNKPGLGEGASSIAELACSVAGTFAPEGRITNNTGNPADHWVRISDPRVQDYQDIMDAVAHTGNGHDNPAYCSCTQGAAAIIRATVDKEFWMISPDDALDYMEQSPNWKYIGISDNLSASELKPGDVLGHSGHTMIWVSNEVAKKYSPNTTGNVYEAGYSSYSFPGIDQYSNGYIGGGFKVYRFVGTPNPGIDASKYLKR